MNNARINKLKARCYEQAIRMDQSRKCGKLIPDLAVAIDLYNIMGEILDHLKKDTECQAEPG